MTSPPSDTASDPASLDNLHDIMIAEPVSWFPPAPGWIILLSFIVVLLILFITYRLVLWWSNAYRRAAVKELNQLKVTTSNSSNDVVNHHLILCKAAEILKRTALVVSSRENVAGLTGNEWIDWLNQHGGGALFENDVAELLAVKMYNSEISGLTSDVLTETIQKIRSWVMHHESLSLDEQRI